MVEKRPAHRPKQFGERKTINIKMTAENVEKLKVIADVEFEGNSTATINRFVEIEFNNLLNNPEATLMKRKINIIPKEKAEQWRQSRGV